MTLTTVVQKVDAESEIHRLESRSTTFHLPVYEAVYKFNQLEIVDFNLQIL